MFHGANIDRDFPLLMDFAARNRLAIKFGGLGRWVGEMGFNESPHDWLERIRLSSVRYGVAMEPLPSPSRPSSSKYKFRHWPYIM